MLPQGPFVLIHGNNLYVSCERVFRPTLEGRPVIVLSNNDGCAIVRSNESKSQVIDFACDFENLTLRRPMAVTTACSP